MNGQGLNPAAAHLSLVYLQDYCDLIESLPNELSRQYTKLKELESSAQSILTFLYLMTSKQMKTEINNQSI
jgi:hypothetical protein